MSTRDPRATVLAFLQSQGLRRPDDSVVMTALTGGVSSDLWKVDLPDGSICVKSSLAQLKVSREWLAPLSRNRVECDWLRFAASLCPGHVPRVLAADSDAGLFAMEYLPPEQYPVWKTELLAGRVSLRAAHQVGDLVGRIHAASTADPSIPGRFATDTNFVALRIAPYLRATSEVHPDLRHTFDALAERTMSTRRALVHGDVSPKNILLGSQGPLLIDAECAWFGDPAFDVAFCVNHLLIKSILLPERLSDLVAGARSLARAHFRHVDWEARGPFESRVASLLPALALARVDGMSPVEYLDESQQDTLRYVSRSLLQKPPQSFEELLTRWACALGSAPAADAALLHDT